VEASCCPPTYGNLGTYHRHECDYAIRAEGPGPGKDRGNKGLILGSDEEKEVL